MSFYNTIDLDTNNKQIVMKVFLKIVCCPYLFNIEQKSSLQKGWHFKLKCLINCDICRLVFDDPIRYAYDQFRKPYSRNVLFQEKEFFKGVKNG